MPSRALTRCLILVTVATSAISATAQQNATTAVVESDGEAKIAVAPDSVQFEFAKPFEGPTLTDAAAQATAFEKALAKALADLDAVPMDQAPVRLETPDLARPRIVATVSTAYLAPEMATPRDAKPTAYPLVELAEKVRKAALSLMAEVKFAGFDVKDRESSEQEAIARASENALYHAEAVGTLLEGQVLGAEKVTILETRWDGMKSETLSAPPRLECVARVRIAYQYSTRAR